MKCASCNRRDGQDCVCVIFSILFKENLCITCFDWARKLMGL